MSRFAVLLVVLVASAALASAQMEFGAFSSANSDVDLYADAASDAFFASAAPLSAYYAAEDADTATFAVFGGKEAMPALTRPTIFKQRPTQTQRVVIPVLLSTTTTTKVATLPHASS